MVFEIFTFHFYLEEKMATVKYCSYEWKHIIKKNSCAFVTLRQSDSSIDGKNGELLS